jgi:exodeoxyribonuclease V alpha subunit
MADKLIKGTMRVSAIKYNQNNFGILIVTPLSMVEDSKYSLPTYDKGGKTITIKGNCPTVERGGKYSFSAKEVADDKWGMQYQIIFINEDVNLESEDDKRRFLSQIVTPSQLETLYTLPDAFKTIKDEDVHTLSKLKGIGVTTAMRIINKYKSTIDYSSAYVKLSDLKLSDNMIKKLSNHYGSPDILVEKFEENPYVLCEDVNGIGFKKADEYALRGGMEKNSPKRIKAFIKHYLEEEAQQGNSWLGINQVADNALIALGDMDKKIIGKALMDMPELWFPENKRRVGLLKYYKLESNIAKELDRLLNTENVFEYKEWREAITKLEANMGFEYTDEQKDGAYKALNENVCAVTGLGGTGKTTVTKALMEVLKCYSIGQCALSGKASQRMAEVTGYDASTIHRMLGTDPETRGFMYHKNNKLPYDIIILDEASMVGGELFYDLIQAIPTGAKFIILGDAGQLSSIGACNVFHDILTSSIIPCAKLTQIHRQAQKSAIITESIKIRKMEQLFNSKFEGKKILGELQDLELDIYQDSAESAKKLLMQFIEKLPTVKSILDIQVLVSMKERGDICTFRINNAIQKYYNPDGNNPIEISLSKELKYKLSEGDKVINIQNNYNAVNLTGEVTPIFNGNIGIIEKINMTDDLMVVRFEGIGRVLIKKDNYNTIQLGYAISFHKSQGSQWHTVIVAVDYSAYMLLCCELLYTGITRAQKYCVLVGENKAIRYATSVSKTPVKQTHLSSMLKVK